MIHPPSPADPREQDKIDLPVDPKTAQKTKLKKKNEKEFREGVEKLFQMAGELKEEVEKTPTMEVLSVRMYKKMQELEKLTQRLKDSVRG